MFASFIWRAIGDRIERRVKEAEDYATAELVKRWEAEGAIAQECMCERHKLESRVSDLERELRSRKVREDVHEAA